MKKIKLDELRNIRNNSNIPGFSTQKNEGKRRIKYGDIPLNEIERRIR